MACCGRRDNVSIPNATQSSCLRMLEESPGMLHMDFVSLMSSLLCSRILGMEEEGGTLFLDFGNG